MYHTWTLQKSNSGPDFSGPEEMIHQRLEKREEQGNTELATIHVGFKELVHILSILEGVQRVERVIQTKHQSSKVEVNRCSISDRGLDESITKVLPSSY